MREYDDFDHFQKSIPYDCILIGVEMGGVNLEKVVHPIRSIYLLGAEDGGLPKDVLTKCQRVVSIESIRMESYNVAVAGSIIMYDRLRKGAQHVQ